MTKIIDAVGTEQGVFMQNSGQGASWINGKTGNVNPAHVIYEAACGRPKMFSSEQNVNNMVNFSPGRKNYVIFDSYLHFRRAFGYDPPSATGQYSQPDRAQFWSYAANNTTFPNGYNTDSYLLGVVQDIIDGGITYAPLRINRESPNLANEAPIAADTEAYDSVTMWRRVIPQMRALAAANNLKMPIIWNTCGGPDTAYLNQLLGFPGWDMVDAVGPDIYAGSFTGSYYPVVPMWKNVTIASAVSVGATTLTRNSSQAPMSANETVTVGTGTANAETVVIASNSGATFTFKTALVNNHDPGERITKQYALGEICHWYGVFYQSKTANNTAAPPNDSWVETANWKPISFYDLPAATQKSARAAWENAFNYSFYSQDANGNVVANKPFNGQFWYDFARNLIDMSTLNFDPRVDISKAKNLDFYLPEWGMVGRINTKGGSSCDAFVWMEKVFGWMAAMKLRDGIGVKGGSVWNHDDGYDYVGQVPRSTYSILPPNIKGTQMSDGPTGTTAPGRFFPLAGDSYLKLVAPGGQVRAQRVRRGRRKIAGMKTTITK